MLPSKCKEQQYNMLNRKSKHTKSFSTGLLAHRKTENNLLVYKFIREDVTVTSNIKKL